MKQELFVIDLHSLSWPASRLGEAMEVLARKSGLAPRPVKTPIPPHNLARDGNEAVGRWIEAAAGCLGLEAEPQEAPYGEAEQLVRNAGPALLRLPGKDEPRFLALLTGQRMVSILGLDLAVHRLQPAVVRTALCQALEAPVAAEVDRLLNEAGVPDRRWSRAREAILRELLSSERLAGSWLLRLPPGAPFWQQLHQVRLSHRLFALVGAHAVQYLLWLLSWWMVGQGALQGRLDWGWLLAWALLLLTLVPFRLLATWLQGLMAIGVGGLLKQRLLCGALRLEPDEIHHQGVGQLLGRVIEAEAVESLALSGGFLALVSGVELVMAALVLGAGAGGWLHALLLGGWVTFTCCIGWQYFRRRRHWTETRLGMTHDLVERMVGHRTRLVQEARERWHEGEDQALARYLELSGTMDRSGALLLALAPRGWLILGLLGLAPSFVSGRGSPALLAVGLGGLLLAFRALQKLAAGLSQLAGAAISWAQVAPLFRAAAHPEVQGSPDFALASASTRARSENEQTVIEAHDLVFRYRDRGEPVLKGVNLRVCAGDRLLVEGPSGGGKSTLASVLIGLRRPESGLLLLNGLDRQTLGSAGWRRWVVAAPQFHENHVLTGTFAFNLLMGRRWPPQPGDVEEAEALCGALGLGDLLGRMPAGLLQMVGETGWQLSHGEKSRLYIARALLQGADLVVLDESFAALDPENLQRALRCVLDRASTLLVIAHP
jgi:ABC-type multidrug transport system fused ATPase/permease subunit